MTQRSNSKFKKSRNFSAHLDAYANTELAGSLPTVSRGVVFAVLPKSVREMPSLASRNIQQNRRMYVETHLRLADRAYHGVCKEFEPGADKWPPRGPVLTSRDRRALKEASGWWLKAARAGSTEAQLRLGVAFRDGRGVPKDEEMALQCFKRASNLGHGGSRALTDDLIEKQQQRMMMRTSGEYPAHSLDTGSRTATNTAVRGMKPNAACPCGSLMTWSSCCGRCRQCSHEQHSRRHVEKARMSLDKLNLKLETLEEKWGMNGRWLSKF